MCFPMPSLCVCARACLCSRNNVSDAVSCSFVEHIATMCFCGEVEATTTTMTATVLLTRISNIFAFFFSSPFQHFRWNDELRLIVSLRLYPPPLFYPQALTRNKVGCASSLL